MESKALQHIGVAIKLQQFLLTRIEWRAKPARQLGRRQGRTQGIERGHALRRQGRQFLRHRDRHQGHKIAQRGHLQGA
jgi:hypothetical protein